MVLLARKNEAVEGDIPPTTALRSIVSTKDAGVIIGKSGKNVSEIREQSGAKVTISEMIPGAYERILTVSGPLDTVAKVNNPLFLTTHLAIEISIASLFTCTNLLPFDSYLFQAYSLVAQKTISETLEPDATPETESVAIRILVSHHRMGSVIGKGGSKIKEIQEASGARLVASEEILPGSTERTITITGVPDAIHIAVYHVGLVLQSAGNDRDRVTVVPYRPMGRNAYGGGPMGGGGGHGGYGASGYYGGYPSHGGYGGHHGGGGGGHHGGYGQDYLPISGGGGASGVAAGGSMTQAQQIFIPNDMVGSVIGKGGSKINEIRQTSGSHIKIAEAPSANNERLVTITGTPESNQMAVYLLYSRLESEKARQ